MNVQSFNSRINGSAIVVLCLFLSVLCGCEGKNGEYMTVVRELKAQVAINRSSMPMQLNSYTVLSSMSFDEETRIITYVYKVDPVMSKVITEEGREEVRIGILNSLHHQLPESEPFTNTLQKHGIVYKYIYYDMEGTLLFSFVITPEEVLTGESKGKVILPEAAAA